MKKLVLVLVWLMVLAAAARTGARAWLDEGCSTGSDGCCVESAASTDPDCQTVGNRCDTCDGSTKPDDYCCTAGGGCSVTVAGNPPSTTTVPIWTFLYGAECKVTENYNERTGNIECNWTWDYHSCSSSDRCEDAGAGNVAGACGGNVAAGSNNNGKILSGVCDAATCPGTGCKNGGWYKTCCKYNDLNGNGRPSLPKVVGHGS